MTNQRFPHMDRVKKRWQPRFWASLKPFGIGEQHPNNFKEIGRALWENRTRPRYAWRIINQGVCDGCALGVAGLHDWTMEGVHLCNIRLRLLRLNTIGPFNPKLLKDISPLHNKSGAELRELGRLPVPMVRRRGELGFRQISWDAALDLIADRIKASSPDRLGFYLTSRGTPNETYYAAQKAVRAMGTNNVDNAARVCHAPSTATLKAAVGAGASTCSYGDWIGTDLLVFIGANPANNQPVTTKYLYYAKKAGTKVVLVNTYREPGMERYWVPSVVESAVFGTKIADETFLITGGGDVAFLNGAITHVFEQNLHDAAFVTDHTDGMDELKAELASQTWDDLERHAGVPEARMREFGDLVGKARTAVFVWSMGVTQHVTGEDNIRAIINLALTRGFVGRERCGLMPIRGHSGVQGAAEMGCYATAFPGGEPVSADSAAALGEAWGFPVPAEPGLTAPEMMDAAHAGDLDVMFAMGGNFLDVMPDPPYVERALERIPLRVHQDIVLSSQMLVDPAETVVLLPATTRYEVPGGVTETSTERRIIFSPEITGPRVKAARPEWQVFLDLARRVRPDLAEALTFRDSQALREEIARVVPFYDGIQTLRETGNQVQYGGPLLCDGWTFATGDGKAHFTQVPLPRNEVPDGMFAVATRRGKQFNSIVHERKDSLTGAVREAVLMSASDARDLGLSDGDAVQLRNDTGTFTGRVAIAPIKPRNLQIHWPEGNVLIDPHRRSSDSHVPDYNAYVTLERVVDRDVSAAD